MRRRVWLIPGLVCAWAATALGDQSSYDQGYRLGERSCMDFDRVESSYSDKADCERGAADAQREQAERERHAAEQTEQLRRQVEQMPALPASKNPLLGAWKPIEASGDVLQWVQGVMCMTLAVKQLELRADSLVHDGVVVEGVQYRQNQNGLLFLLGSHEPYRLVTFALQGPNRISTGECAFQRIGAVAAAPASPPRPASAAAPAPIVAAATPGRTYPAAGFTALGFRLGKDTKASVVESIRAKGGQWNFISFGSPVRIASRDKVFSGLDPRAIGLVFEFEADEWAAPLTMVGVMYVPDAGIARERVGALTRKYGLSAPSATTPFRAETSGVAFRVSEDEEPGVLIESYRVVPAP